MRLIDKRFKVSRREMLRSGGAVAAAATVAPVTVVTGKAFAATPVALSEESFKTLVQMARDIYPHDKIADRYYAAVIEGLDASAKSDAALKTMLAEGVTALDAKALGMKYGSYSSVPTEEERVAILQAIE